MKFGNQNVRLDELDNEDMKELRNVLNVRLKERKKTRKKIELNDPTTISTDGVIGLSTVDVSDSLQGIAEYRTEYLRRVVECLDGLGVDKVDIVWGEDMPAVFGSLDEEMGRVTGVTIAPNVGTKPRKEIAKQDESVEER